MMKRMMMVMAMVVMAACGNPTGPKMRQYVAFSHLTLTHAAAFGVSPVSMTDTVTVSVSGLDTAQLKGTITQNLPTQLNTIVITDTIGGYCGPVNDSTMANYSGPAVLAAATVDSTAPAHTFILWSSSDGLRINVTPSGLITVNSCNDNTGAGDATITGELTDSTTGFGFSPRILGTVIITRTH